MFGFIYSTMIDPLLRDIRVHTPEFSGMKARDKVLDVCCGTGDQAFHYAKRGIIATGIDLNPNMIRAAERNKRKQGLSNVSFLVADAANLPFKDDFFDYASISLTLHETEKTVTDTIISEMKRVAKKEGVLIFIDFQVPPPKNLFTYLTKAIEFIHGQAYFRYLKAYIEQGGLGEILKTNQLIEEKKDYLKSRLIVIIKARNT